MRRFVLTITCPDRTGIVAAVTRFIADRGGWVVEAAQHGDLDTGMFFQRIEVLAESLSIQPGEFEHEFAPIAAEFRMEWRLWDTALRRRVLICVSREGHCLSDLLHRWRSNDLDCDIVGVVSNHDDLRELVEWHGIPWHRVDLSGEGTAAGFAELESLFEMERCDVMVLARFMQLIPPGMCER